MPLEIEDKELEETKTAEAEKSLSYWKIIRREFFRSWINKVGLFIILVLGAVAIFAPFLANSEPVYVKYQGKTYFPVLQTLWPLSEMNLYPEIRHWDWDKLEKRGAIVRYTIVPYSPNDYDLDSIL
ncbi:MAG: hypothetical protein R3257_07650, partial [bacterium]|nr:hypothetical protein [bacterium]